MYVSLNGEPIPNHGYVVISDIGYNNSAAVICHINRPISEGDWFAPDGTSNYYYSYYYDSVPGFWINRASMMVRLIRSTRSGPPSEGIYVCGVEDDTFTYPTVYVGLYNNGGGIHNHVLFKECFHYFVLWMFSEGFITIHNGMTLTVDSDFNGASPQFTLTCISTGGPATTVTWTRDFDTVTEGTETVLDDRVTAQYTHTLTVTGRLGGLYTCTVANDKPSEDSAQLIVQGSCTSNIELQGLTVVDAVIIFLLCWFF